MSCCGHRYRPPTPPIPVVPTVSSHNVSSQPPVSSSVEGEVVKSDETISVNKPPMKAGGYFITVDNSGSSVDVPVGGRIVPPEEG